ncbi:MAG: ferritin family protein [Desulfamplus sp.]|nr:ferritin family protein [Desulfamplus sp.]MBF0412394.1 ferritin family protein [Desulfamplus sp.]
MQGYKDIIQYAIDREIEAEMFYKEIESKVSKPILKEMFANFAKEENKHQQILRGVSDNKDAELNFKSTVDYGISETVVKPKISDEMTLADVFTIAMKNEERAMKMYNFLAADSSSESTKKLFEELASMEQGHKLKMENCYTEVAYAEVW